MSIEIKAPQFPESVQDGLIVNWYKKVGDAVERDELLVDIETDKVVLEVNAPNDGVLESILKDADTTVLSLEVIGVIDEQSAGAPTSAPEAEPAPQVESKPAEEVLVNPAAKKMMDEKGINADQVEGTAKGGRISKEDVQRTADAMVESSKPAEYSAPAPASSPAPAPIAAAAPIKPDSRGRGEQRVPMSRLRTRIAQRLLESSHNTAMLTTFNEVNMSALMALRKSHKDAFQERYQAKLGFMSFFLKASVNALQKFPAVNAYIDGNDIIYHDFQDVGVAVSSDRGLVVPVLRDVQNMSLADIELQINEYAQQAQAGKLSIDNMTGGTFTVSNGGVFGSLLSTPIINPPQTAILGMHTIQQRPIALNGEVVIQPMMYLALSYDHRLIDGKEAVQFLVAIKEQLEEPTRILLDI